jgi:glucosaminylphosphatidylinositol acyltransferase
MYKGYLARQGFVVDLATFVFPMLSIITICSQWLFLVLVGCIFSVLSLVFYITSTYKIEHRIKASKSLHRDGDLRGTSATSTPAKSSIERVVISQYRGTILLLTGLTILAVDFGVFPRWMAKTETAGYSVMDLGVGAFVIANSMVAPQAKELVFSNPIVFHHELMIDSFL